MSAEGVKGSRLNSQPQEIERAWVRTYHETGRLIECHILANERAGYGTQVFRGLARDTGASERKLYECAQFYRCFPILRISAKLGWSHYVLLCQVSDSNRREALAKQADRSSWTAMDLRLRVGELNAAVDSQSGGANDGTGGASAAKSAVRLLTPKWGTPGLYRVIDDGDALVVDLGFKFYRRLAKGAASLRPYKAGDIVRIGTDPSTELRAIGAVRRVDDATKADLFTYAATIRRVVAKSVLTEGRFPRRPSSMGNTIAHRT